MLRSNLLAYISLVCFLGSSGSAFGHMERVIFIEGILKSYDSNSAVVVNGESNIRIPAALIKMRRIQTGQYLSVPVDIADFLELNKEILAKNGIQIEPATSENVSPKKVK